MTSDVFNEVIQLGKRTLKQLLLIMCNEHYGGRDLDNYENRKQKTNLT